MLDCKKSTENEVIKSCRTKTKQKCFIYTAGTNKKKILTNCLKNSTIYSVL